VKYEWYKPNFEETEVKPLIPKDNWLSQIHTPIDIPDTERNAYQFLADNSLI
jgi:hypothetical protein